MRGTRGGTIVRTAEGFVARIWIVRAGARSRKVVNLHTTDEATALRKLDALVVELRLKGLEVTGSPPAA